MTKLLTLAAATGFVALTSIAPASAATCEDFAQGCMRNGGKQEVCYKPSLMKTCQKTGKYVGPYSGKVFVRN